MSWFLTSAKGRGTVATARDLALKPASNFGLSMKRLHNEPSKIPLQS